KQEEKTVAFVETIRSYIASKNYELQVFTVGSIFWFAFTAQKSIKRADQIDRLAMEKYKVMHRSLLKQGIYFGRSGYEVGFVYAAHTQEDLDKTIDAIKVALDTVFQ